LIGGDQYKKMLKSMLHWEFASV